MNVSWLPSYWVVMTLIVLPLFFFGIPEGLAIKYGGETFSRFMANMANNGPIGKLWVLAYEWQVGDVPVVSCVAVDEGGKSYVLHTDRDGLKIVIAG